MSRGARLARLEAALPVSRTDRGAYCRDCGGLTISDAIDALDTLDRTGARMTAEAAKAVFDVLEAGKDTCRRCGAVTLAGALRDGATEDAARVTAPPERP
jgi:hypothetical protein